MSKQKNQENKMVTLSYPQILSAYEIANQFLLFGKSSVSETDIEYNGWTTPFLIPTVVNISFSCELFLKVLLSIHQITSKKHDLLSLYRELPKNLQNEIMAQNSSTFFEDLKSISDLFIRWRYLYERMQPLNYPFLYQFAEQLQAISKKELEIYKLLS